VVSRALRAGVIDPHGRPRESVWASAGGDSERRGTRASAAVSVCVRARTGQTDRAGPDAIRSAPRLCTPAAAERPPAAGERPRASRLAQAQIGQLYVPSLACEAIELSNEADEKLLALLDGSLSRSELQGRLGMNADELEANLRRLARLELIEQ